MSQNSTFKDKTLEELQKMGNIFKAIVLISTVMTLFQIGYVVGYLFGKDSSSSHSFPWLVVITLFITLACSIYSKNYLNKIEEEIKLRNSPQ